MAAQIISVWEWIDRIQDILTLIGVPVAVYLLIKIHQRTKKYRGE